MPPPHAVLYDAGRRPPGRAFRRHRHGLRLAPADHRAEPSGWTPVCTPLQSIPSLIDPSGDALRFRLVACLEGRSPGWGGVSFRHPVVSFWKAPPQSLCRGVTESPVWRSFRRGGGEAHRRGGVQLCFPLSQTDIPPAILNCILPLHNGSLYRWVRWDTV